MTHYSNIPQYPLDFTPQRSVNTDAMKIPLHNLPITMLSLKDVRRLLGLSNWSVYQLIRTNKLQSIKIGGRRLISLRAIQEFIAQLEKDSEANGYYDS